MEAEEDELTEEAAEEDSNQELDSIKEDFLKSLDEDEDDDEKDNEDEDWSSSKYTDVKKAKKSATVVHCAPIIKAQAKSDFELMRDKKKQVKSWLFFIFNWRDGRNCFNIVKVVNLWPIS